MGESEDEGESLDLGLEFGTSNLNLRVTLSFPLALILSHQGREKKWNRIMIKVEPRIRHTMVGRYMNRAQYIAPLHKNILL